MHGLGNDFAIFDARQVPFEATGEWGRAICDRRIGVGCDQVMLILPRRNEQAYAYIRILNLDGSEPEACGNGTRCIASLLLPEVDGPRFMLETLGGLLEVDATDPALITVDMGPARFDWKDVPLAVEMDTLNVPIAVPKLGFRGDAVCASMGNPHATFFVPDLYQVDLAEIGPFIEHHPMFPQRVNAGFAQMMSRDRMRFRIWERGSGATLACGSATCAAAVAAMRRGLAERRITVDVQLGSLTVEWREDGHVLLGGPTALVFTGELAAHLHPG